MAGPQNMANLDAALGWFDAHEGLPTSRLARRLIDNGEIERILTCLHLLQPRLEGRPALGRFFSEVTEAIGCIRNCRDFEQVIAVTRRVKWAPAAQSGLRAVCALGVVVAANSLDLRHGTYYQRRRATLAARGERSAQTKKPGPPARLPPSSLSFPNLVNFVSPSTFAKEADRRLLGVLAHLQGECC